MCACIMPGRLFLVATPIGNLQDMTFRAVEVLRSVSRIACEDTRRTRILLAHYQLSKPLLSLPAYDEHERRERVIRHLLEGEDVALVSDAGTPGVSDPGMLTVALALQRGIEVVPLPGASALTTALCASGLSHSRFCFLGFLPKGEGQARRFLEGYASLPVALVFFESPKRLSRSLALMREILGDRRACIARELTKVHEEFLRDSLGELLEASRKRVWLGELVILIEGLLERERWAEVLVDEALKEALFKEEVVDGLKGIAKRVAELSLWSDREVYQRALCLKKLRGTEG
ncbi:MAG: 16S rRNA (cytidine(1402)-2'-O)-methyltransferase [Proteobacteria bacterium]|nr:16S rRNA (cytidine(1402)-2'-O)-methyltransferase [Cystobacterineae bacterium]MCL2314593.1 16S rRNA (cytidine(1402)-2'-O)-methyltransferase [Pseudomonadota bacterium]